MATGAVRGGVAIPVVRRTAGRPVTSMPSIPISNAQAKGMMSTADALAKIAGGLEDELDRRAVADGEAAGRLVGASGEMPELQDAATLRGRAFNREALRTYGTTVELQARERINSLFDQNRADPVALSTALGAYSAGQQRALAQMSPDFAATYALQFKVLSQPFINKAKANQLGVMQAEAKASVMRLEARTDIDIDNIGRDLLSGDAEVANAAALALGSHYVTLTRELNAVGPDGQPLFDADVKQERIQRFRDRVTSSAVRGWFADQPNAGAAYAQFINDDLQITLKVPDENGQLVEHTFNPRSEMSLDERDKLEGRMRSEISFRNAQYDRAEARMLREAQRRRDEAEFDFHNRIENAGKIGADGKVIVPPTWQEIADAVEVRAIDPADGQKLLDASNNPAPRVSDSGVLDGLETRIYAGEDVRPALEEARSRLTPEDLSKLRGLNHRLNVAPGEYNEADEEGKALFRSLAPTGPMEAPDASGEVRRNDAMREYRRRVEAGEVPGDVRRDLESRARSDLYRSTDLRLKALLPPRGAVFTGSLLDIEATRLELQKMVKANTISRPEAVEQMRLLKAWENAQARLSDAVKE